MAKLIRINPLDNVAVAVALDFDAVSQHKAPVATLNADELAVAG